MGRLVPDDFRVAVRAVDVTEDRIVIIDAPCSAVIVAIGDRLSESPST
jgi:hypothetical protein